MYSVLSLIKTENITSATWVKWSEKGKKDKKTKTLGLCYQMSLQSMWEKDMHTNNRKHSMTEALGRVWGHAKSEKLTKFGGNYDTDAML